MLLRDVQYSEPESETLRRLSLVHAGVVAAFVVVAFICARSLASEPDESEVYCFECYEPNPLAGWGLLLFVAVVVNAGMYVRSCLLEEWDENGVVETPEPFGASALEPPPESETLHGEGAEG